MAYVEVRRLGELVTRRWVDDERARRGFGVQLGHLGTVHVAPGEVVRLRKYEVRLVPGARGEKTLIPPDGKEEIPVPEEAPVAAESPPAPAAEPRQDESAGPDAPELPAELPIDEYAAAGRLSRAKVLRLLSRACRCVQRFHDRGEVHRDLRPGNLLVGPDGEVRLVGGGPDASASAGEARDPQCLSPERLAGRSEAVGVRSDVYGLGVVLYRLVVGDWPFDASGTRADLLHRIVSGQVRPPGSLGRRVGRELEVVLSKALTLAPGGRYASAGLLADDIDNCLRRRPLQARELTRGYVLSRWFARHRGPLAAGAVMLALAGAAAGLWWTGLLREYWPAALRQRWLARSTTRPARRAATTKPARPLPADLVAARESALAAWRAVAGLDRGQGFGSLWDAAAATRSGADALVDRQDYAAARRAYAELLARAQSLADRQALRAASAEARERSRRAAKDAQRVDLSGQAAELRAAAGQLADRAASAFAGGEFAEAERLWSEAATQSAGAGAHAKGAADVAAARAAYRQALAGLDADALRARGGQAWAKVADAVRRAERDGATPVQAAEAYRQAASLLPAAAQAVTFDTHLAAARKLGEADKIDEALGEVARALAIRPADAAALALKTQLAAAAAEIAAGWEVLFDGKRSIDWQGGAGAFRVAGDAIVGGSVRRAAAKRAFLYGTKRYGDCEVSLKVKTVGEAPDGGVIVRGRFLDATAALGYRAAVGTVGGQLRAGHLLDEGRGAKPLARPAPAKLRQIWKADGWNDLRVVCSGRRVRVFVNGVRTADYVETRTGAPRGDAVGLEVHPSQAPGEVWYKAIRIRKLPAGGATTSTAPAEPDPEGR